jgi:hypothetical protein
MKSRNKFLSGEFRGDDLKRRHCTKVPLIRIAPGVVIVQAPPARAALAEAL